MDKAILVFFSLSGLVLKKSGSSFVLSDSYVGKGAVVFQDLNETVIILIHR